MERVEKGPMRVLSLGAGLQSSCLALMFAHGEYDYSVDVAIFSDPGWESEETYDWLDKLESLCPFPVIRVSGGNLRDDMIEATQTGARVAVPPVYTKTESGPGPLLRQCTSAYKIEPIKREVRRLLGAAARSRVAEGAVEMLFGISLDEVQRMKDSQVKWITNTYPLIDKRMSRNDCAKWMERHGYPVPPKSACVGCPYRSDASWRDMKLNRPNEWADAVEFDKAIRTGLPGVRNEVYLHSSLLPLDEVDLSSLEDLGQLSLFGSECTGFICGEPEP